MSTRPRGSCLSQLSVRPGCDAVTRVTRVTSTPGVQSLLRGPGPVSDGDDEALTGLECAQPARDLDGLTGVEREGHARRRPGTEAGRLLGITDGQHDDVGRSP